MGKSKTAAEPASEKKKEKKGGALFRIIVVLLLVVIIVLLLLQRFAKEPETEEPPVLAAVKASLGQLEGKTAEEIQAELDRVIGEGMFHVVINTDPVFANGAAEGSLEIENVPNNHYSMRVAIYREDTGDLIYDSGLIDPNYHIQRDRLDVELAAGDYPSRAIFYAYDSDTLEEMGNVASRITIHVLN